MSHRKKGRSLVPWRGSTTKALLPAKEVAPFLPIEKVFIESYLDKKTDTSAEDWLRSELAKQLPHASAEEIATIVSDIFSALHRQEQKKVALRQALAQGQSVEDWFVAETLQATSAMPVTQASEFIRALEQAVTPKPSRFAFWTRRLSRKATEELFLGVAGQAGYELAQKLWDGQKIEKSEILRVALGTGADLGVKAALAGAVKVGVERGIIKFIPKATSSDVIAGIVDMAVDESKILKRLALREISLREGLEQLEVLTVTASAGILLSAKTAVVGAVWGAAFGPVGAAFGGFLGGTIGYLSGAQAGELGLKGIHKLIAGLLVMMKYVGTASVGVGKHILQALKRRELTKK